MIELVRIVECQANLYKERKPIKKIKTATGMRTLFFVEANQEHAKYMRDEQNINNIMHKMDYASSHLFVRNNPQVTLIVYPSCRDPQQRDNVAVLDISRLEKNIKWESIIKFFYDNRKQE